ncbi:hypothetical protein QBC44DRAFT_383159 [Cladorrhinum sp. PSN332]|nr:hypothetical protein QBC44DRAFT_383159 [Cladorrhinum sp. PSN332]
MADSCLVHGNADMYGIGIRLGFYLQWLASILANFFMIESEIRSSRFSLLSYTGAVIIALAVQNARKTATDLDTYIVIFLCFGASYAQIPIFLWRILTCFNADMDPTRWTTAASSTFLSMFSTLVLVAIAGMQYVFWISLPSESDKEATAGCKEYGFLFVPVSLYGTALKAVNLTLSTLLLLISSLGWIQWIFSSRHRGFLKETKVQSTQRTTTLIRLRCFVSLVVAVTVITGAELTISWNHVQGISELDTPGQLISFILGLVVFSRVIWTRSQHQPNEARLPSSPLAAQPVWLASRISPGRQQQMAHFPRPSYPPVPEVPINHDPDNFGVGSSPTADIRPPPFIPQPPNPPGGDTV